MLRFLYKYFSLLVLIAIITVPCKAQKYPATAALSITPPYSVFLSDYATVGENRFQATIFFNDFNEPYWDVRFRLTIESAEIRIRTKPDFVALQSLRIIPGQPITLTGADLSSYFNPANNTVEGILPRQFAQNSKLPEGMYNFCLEVLDAKTGKELSTKQCTQSWVQMIDPARLILPSCTQFIQPSSPQNIIFQWTQVNGLSNMDLSQMGYVLELYEVTDLLSEPLSALANSKVLQIHTSEILNQTIYLYDNSLPPLEVGKRYIWRVQSKLQDGKQIFKNNGFSEVCWFTYGQTNNGTITLEQPANRSSFLQNVAPPFKWSAPSNQTFGQDISYHLRITEMSEGQQPEDAIANNPVWYEFRSNSGNASGGYAHLVTLEPEKEKTYGWQVTASNMQGQIAQSPVSVFYGPGFIESFRAGMQTVYVKATYNKDLNSLSGQGIVVAGSDTIPVEFQNLNILKIGGWHVLNYGTIEQSLYPRQLNPIFLNPELSENGKAEFEPTVFRVSTKGFEIKGKIIWDFPHATYPNGTSTIVSEENWMDYNYYKISGKLGLTAQTTLPLLEPLGCSMVLNTISDFFIDQNIYKLRFYGHFQLPSSIAATENDILKIPFENIPQTHYVFLNSLDLRNNLKIVRNTNLEMRPRAVTIDLSDDKSPDKQSNLPLWKGLYIHQFDFVSLPLMDESYQVSLEKKYIEPVATLERKECINFIDGTGWQFQFKSTFVAQVAPFVNTFPCRLNNFEATIENSKLRKAQLLGSLLIPFISTTQYFSYTINIDEKGFQPAFLEGLDNYHFLHNKDQGENEIAITVLRGVFADNERVDMNLTLEWKKLSSKIDNLTGFSAWGNYNIGFGTPNGTKELTTIIKQDANGYPMELTTVGAGNSKGLYAFGVSGTMNLGEDISGDDGPPVVSLYSLAPCELLGKNNNPGYKDDAHFDMNDPKAVQENLTKQISNFFAGNTQVKKQAQAMLNEASITTIQAQEAIPLDNILATESKEDDKNAIVEIDRAKLILLLRGLASVLPLNETEKELVEKLALKIESISDEQFEKFLHQGLSLEAWFKEFLNHQVDKMLLKYTTQLNARATKINTAIRKPIDSKVLEIDAWMGTKIDALIDKIAEGILKNASEKNLEIKNKVAAATKKALKAEIKRSFDEAVEKNITGKITAFIKKGVADRIALLLKKELYKLSYALLDQNARKSFEVEDILKNTEAVFNDIANDLTALLDLNSISTSITSTGKSFINNIKIENVYDAVAKELIGATVEQYIKTEAAKLIDKGYTSLVGDGMSAAVTGEVVKNVADNVKFDFTDLGSKLKEGKIEKIVTFDPTTIKIETKIADINGSIRFTKDDPTWGNSWQGQLKATIKMPEPGFMISCIYINGKKEDYKFWFIEIEGRGLGIPLGTIPLSLDGAKGRVYHHMTKNEARAYLPDRNTSYGGSLDMYFYDTQSKGTSVKLGVGVEIAILADGFSAELRGEVAVNNSDDRKSMVLGQGYIGFNSVKKEFAGSFKVEVNAYKVLCGSGELGWNMTAGKGWQIWVGKEEDPIKLDLLCLNAITATTYMELSNESFALGLGIHAGFALVTPWVGIDAARARAYLRAGFDFKASTKLIFKPLHIDRANIYIGIYVALGIDYETALKDGTLELIDIAIYGLLDYQATPTSHMRGELGAKVEVLGIGFDMKFEVDRDL